MAFARLPQPPPRALLLTVVGGREVDRELRTRLRAVAQAASRPRRWRLGLRGGCLPRLSRRRATVVGEVRGPPERVERRDRELDDDFGAGIAGEEHLGDAVREAVAHLESRRGHVRVDVERQHKRAPLGDRALVGQLRRRGHLEHDHQRHPEGEGEGDEDADGDEPPAAASGARRAQGAPCAQQACIVQAHLQQAIVVDVRHVRRA
mmetsp:Transcript_42223/g.111154  ORF Transcript_42223/g.111154 Transcript_42223/m.111154 type:complete len:206 (-) Transcript_42223:124-741(-)